ncbi:MAG: helix-turn-helix domain-containing protein [Eubacteriales bacterium]
MNIYEKILYCRKKAGISQETFAEKLGVSRQAISKWECGTAAPDLDNLLAISKLFGVTTDWLLDDAQEIPGMQIDTIGKAADDQITISETPKKVGKKMKFLTDDQWKMAVPPFMIGLMVSGLGLLIRSLIDWIFKTIFGDLETLTGAANVVYVVLSSVFFFLMGVGVILSTVGICLMIGYFIYNRTKH